jgi:3-oxoacyl-[acyl-carrier-protein] synthase-3
MGRLMATDVYLSSISYELGERVPIADLADEPVRAGLAILADEGIRYCRVATAPLAELASASARRTMAEGRTPELIVYSQDTFTGQPAVGVARLAVDAGIPRTSAITVGGNGCGNLGPSLRVAGGLLRADGLTSVLVVTADRATGDTRYLPDGLTVLSDTAASFLVTSELTTPGFRLLGLAVTSRADLDGASGDIVAAKAVVDGVRSASRQVFDAAGVKPGDCRRVLVGNYGNAMRATFATAAGFGRDDAYAPLVAEHGHCFAADILIALRTLVDSGEVAHGDLLLGITTGRYAWTAMLLEHVAS